MAFKDLVSDLYVHLIDKKILQMNIQESKATCHNCLRARDQRFKLTYKENLKCCTFVPFIPNYALGALLTENISGQAKIRQMIADRRFALPLGLFPDLNYQYKFTTKKENEFGNNPDLLCHYFDTDQNQCSIWKYRGVVCTTFYCQSSYGQLGKDFWSEMKDYLSYVEMALAEDCLVMKDFSPRDISDQLIFLNKTDFNNQEKKQKTLTAEQHKTLWNGYSSPEDFYISCYKMVQKLDRSSFKEILSQQGLGLEKNVNHQWNKVKQCLTSK